MADSIENTAIWADVRDIMQSENSADRDQLRVMIHTKTHDIVPYKLLSFSVAALYAENVGATHFVKLQIPNGEYTAKVYPSKANLEVSIKIVGNAGKDNKTKSPVVKRFRAIFPPGQNPSPTGSSNGLMSEEDQNAGGFQTILLELIDKGVEAMTLKNTGDCFSGITPEDLLRLIIGRESSQVQIDGQPAIQAIDIIKPTNQDPFSSIIIPDGTPVIKIPDYLQEKVGGLYSQGMGSFIQVFEGKRTFFVYPLYDYNRFDNESRRLIIYMVPQSRFSGVDATCKVDGKIVKILTTSDVDMQDDNDVSGMNEGSGFRMTDARAMMKKPVLIEKDGIKASRAQLNHEVAIESRDDGYNKGTKTLSPSSNPYKHYSKLLAASSQKVTIQWDHSNPDLIFPGMPCSFVFVQDGKRASVRGTVHSHLYTTSVQGTSQSETYTTQSTLVIAIEKNSKIPQQSTVQSTGSF